MPYVATDWPCIALGELVDQQRGISYGIVQPGSETPNGVPILRVNDIHDGRVQPQGFMRVSPEIEAKHQRTRLRGGEVVLTVVGAYFGQCAIVPMKYANWNVARAVAVIPLRDDVDARWIACCLRSKDIQQLMQVWATTTAQPTLNLRDVARLPIPMPSPELRNSISDIAFALDDKIELNRRMNETLESMARALFQSWFVDFDPVRAKAAVRREHPHWSNPEVSRAALPNLTPEIAELFPDSFEVVELVEIPTGWSVKCIPEVIEVNPLRSLSKGSVAPYLEMSNMPTTSARATAWERRDFGSGTKFINGDTLVARITPCLENGKTAFVDFLAENEVGWGSTEYIVLHPMSPLPPIFAYLLARTDNFRQHLITNMTGTSGRQRAPADCLDKLQVVVPNEVGIAKAFGDSIEVFLLQIKANDFESSELIVARDSLLPKLLSGDLAVATTSNQQLSPTQ